MARRADRYAKKLLAPNVTYGSGTHRLPEHSARSAPAGHDQHWAFMRASDHDRDRAAIAVTEAFIAGQLDNDEHGGRLSATYRARTLGELAQLTADLPTRPMYTEAA